MQILFIFIYFNPRNGSVLGLVISLLWSGSGETGGSPGMTDVGPEYLCCYVATNLNLQTIIWKEQSKCHCGNGNIKRVLLVLIIFENV